VGIRKISLIPCMAIKSHRKPAKNTTLREYGDQMEALEQAKQAKKENIIDMAVGFVRMITLFQEGSAGLIKEKLTKFFEGLDRVSSEQDFRKMHRDFCQSFVKTIRLAESEQPASYGHNAMTLDRISGTPLRTTYCLCNMMTLCGGASIVEASVL
jgi:hypothetical protein